MAKSKRASSTSKKGISKNKPVSRSDRAGITFSVGRVHRKLRDIMLNKRISAGTPIYMAAVIEYMVTELLDMAINETKAKNKLRITPRFLLLAIRGDEDFAKKFAKVIIAQGGVVPNIEASLLPQKKTDDSKK